MKISTSGAQYSSIVGVTEQLKRLQAESGQEYLLLNRGVNAVVPIDLSEVVKLIDFNSPAIQVYSPNSGRPELKAAVNQAFFQGETQDDKLIITAGGMNGLDLSIQTLDVERVYFARYFWAAYPNIAIMRDKEPRTYQDFQWLYEHADEIKGQAVIICDPNNPVGNKVPDEQILELVEFLDRNHTVVIYDSPYRRVFFDDDDTLYRDLLRYEHVIIHESFSKSVGLSGQRMGFLHAHQPEFRQELSIRLLYETNSINGFAQTLMTKLLTTTEGQTAVQNFKTQTRRAIKENIQFLRSKGLLVEELYENAEPMGIFVVLNQSADTLLAHRIGSVSMKYFTLTEKEQANQWARACVSVPSEKLKQFFTPFV